MRHLLTPELRDILEAPRREGRTALLEPEGLALLQGLGIPVPVHVFIPDVAACATLDLDRFPGTRVVVKVVSPRILHKSEVRGVAVVRRDRATVTEAVGDMAERLGDRDLRGFLVSEFIPHDPSLDSQLLVGLRWTDDFGPVVSLGPGGIQAEFLAARFPAGEATTILSAGLPPGERLPGLLKHNAFHDLITHPFRGRPARISASRIEEILEIFLALAAEAGPHLLRELEINPLVLTEHGAVALDVLALLGTGTPPEETPPRPVEKLDRLLRPRSLGIIGVSDRPNPGHIILANTLARGFPREKVTVIKPGVESVLGCRCVPDVASMPEPVDLFILSVGAAQVPELVDALVSGRKAESLIVIPGGLGETPGSEAIVARMQSTLHEARGSAWRGPLINGGNCLGVRSLPGRVDTLFIPGHKLPPPTGAPSPLAILSQSGAFAVARASKLEGLNPRYLVTLGNQQDLTLGDYLEHLADDPELRIFACYVEGFRPGDGLRWLRAARRITESGRHVLLYRAGRTAEGAGASASHTASIAGDYAVTRELARGAGVVVADSLADFDDLVKLFTLLDGRTCAGWSLGAVSNAGFECVALADNLGPFQLADLSPATRTALEALLRQSRLEGIVAVNNPLDLTPMMPDAGFAEAASLVLGDPGVDAGIVGCVPLTAALQTLAPGNGHDEDVTHAEGVAGRLVARFHADRKPWVAVVDAGPLYDPLAAALERGGIPLFRTADRALRLFGLWCGRVVTDR